MHVDHAAIQKMGRQDPVRYVKWLWPHVQLYDKQRTILESLRDNYETYVVAGNMLGKDYCGALAVLVFFLTRTPCRVVTTSADYSQLEAVLWGEMRRQISDAAYPLSAERGGPIIDNHLHLKKRTVERKGWKACPLSYVIGRVAKKGEGLLGHHVADVGDGIDRTLFFGDEASGVADENRERAMTWARRMLFIGNPYPPSLGCTFFKDAVTDGDLLVGQKPRHRGR